MRMNGAYYAAGWSGSPTVCLVGGMGYTLALTPTLSHSMERVTDWSAAARRAEVEGRVRVAM